MSTEVLTALIVLGFIALVLFIILMIALIWSNRRRLRLYRKADILLEDLTYKSELLNPSVETLAKLANYIDVFEVFTRKSIKSAVKLVARNRDDIYKVLNRLKKMLVGRDESGQSNSTATAQVAKETAKNSKPVPRRQSTAQSKKVTGKKQGGK